MISGEPLLKLKAKYNDNPVSVKLVCGHIQQIVKIPNHPTFSIVDKIILSECEQNQKCLKLLAKGSIELPYKLSLKVIQRCKQNFRVDIKIDLHHFAISVITPSDQKQSEKKNKTIFEILDTLDYHIILKIFKNAYQSLGTKIHNRVTRKLKNYIDHTKRKQDEKIQLEHVYEMYRLAAQQQNANLIKNIESLPNQTKHNLPNFNNIVNNEKQQIMVNKMNNDDKEKKSRNIRTNITSKNSKQKYKNHSKQKYRSRNSRSKQAKIHEKILLGITGDSEDGWRARMRPSRIPKTQEQQNQVIKSNSPKYDTINNNQQTANNIKVKVQQHSQTKTEIPKKQQHQKSMTKIHEYIKADSKEPKDGGQYFDFQTIKQEFSLLVNKNFWIKYNNSNKRIDILKGGDGYMRFDQIQIIQNGFHAEGITILIGGMSSLEDGGHQIGNPKIQDFTQGQSSFIIQNLEIYTLR